MVWRADIRTPRILATALERLADLSKDPTESDPEAEETTAKTQPSRQEILESGEEVRRLMCSLFQHITVSLSTKLPGPAQLHPVCFEVKNPRNLDNKALGATNRCCSVCRT